MRGFLDLDVLQAFVHHEPMSPLSPILSGFLLTACNGSSVGIHPLDTNNPWSRDSGVESVPGAWSPPVHDSHELPTGMPTVNLRIDSMAMDRLDANPYAAPDERGVFIDDHGVSHAVDLNYRGAYELQAVMAYYDLRNWKVKFAADDLYLDRREWNFNYEPNLVQKLAYDLFRFAGVAVSGAQHVVLQLNGTYQGMYLRYEDPDNAGWLWDEFGDDDGDLYKAAYDIPGETQCFADLTWLGPDDMDYFCHYSKKTNDEVAPNDFAVLRTFVSDLNNAPDEDFPAWLDAHVDVERLRSYLVVSNFIANWDSYPQRPKNYWLYDDRRSGKMVYIPWDLNGTFSPDSDPTYNQMGTSASVLYDLLENDYEPVHDDEGVERPLVRRMMTLEDQQQAYLDRYRELSQTILSESYLDDRLTALAAIVEPEISRTDLTRLQEAEGTVRTFIERRTETVEAELERLE